jgi:hypothetical protein
MNHNTKRRMGQGRCSNSPRGGRGDCVTPTQRRYGERSADPTAPRAALGQSGALRPTQGGQEAVRWAGNGAQW